MGAKTEERAVRKTVPYAEWRAEAERLFGPSPAQWRFVCPVCGYEQSPGDFKAIDAPLDAAGFSCIGRWVKDPAVREAFESFGVVGKGPCNYAGGGLFQLNPITVQMPDGIVMQVFAFAEATG